MVKNECERERIKGAPMLWRKRSVSETERKRERVCVSETERKRERESV